MKMFAGFQMANVLSPLSHRAE